jgi:hypothetical protein
VNGGLADGAQLMRASFQLVRRRPALLWFPVVSTLCLALSTGFWIYEGFWFYSASGAPFLLVLLALAAVYTLSFVSIFFGVALAGAADAALDGGDPSFGAGVGLAWTRLGSIAGWAAYSVCVSLALGVVKSIKGLRWAGDAAQIAWGFATLFVVPLIAIEGAGAADARRRSFTLAREEWRAESGGLGALTAAIFVPALLFALDAKLLFEGHVHSPSAKLVLGLVLVIGLAFMTCVGVVRQVFAVELYRESVATVEPAQVA